MYIKLIIYFIAAMLLNIALIEIALRVMSIETKLPNMLILGTVPWLVGFVLPGGPGFSVPVVGVILLYLLMPDARDNLPWYKYLLIYMACLFFAFVLANLIISVFVPKL
jgi:hypothetical protein